MTITRLVFVAAQDAAWPFLRVADDGAVLQRGALAADAPRPETPDEDRLVVPGADVLARWLDLPDRNDVQARSAASFLLQDQIVDEGEALHVAVGDSDEGGQRLAVVTRAGAVARWLEQARARGVAPVSLTPDYLMLPPPEGEELVTAGFGDLVAARGRNLAFSLEQDLAATVIGERPCRRLTLPELEQALAARAATPAVNLLQGRFGAGQAPARPGGRRRLAIMAAVLAASPLLLLLAQTGRDLVAAQSLETRARQRAIAVAPALARADDPVAALRARLDRLRAADRFPGLTARLFTVLEKTPGAELDSLVYSEAGGLSVRVAYSNFSDMDQMTALGRDLGIDIRQDSTVTEGARVTSDLTIRRLP